jgi:hypothetical protein
MPIEVESRWGDDSRPIGRMAFGVLRIVGHTLRWVAFSVLTLLAPFIRVGLAIAALGGFLVILLALARPHRHPFPYEMMITFSVVSAVLYTLFDRLLLVLQPQRGGA